ncbi:MAG: TolC family protein [bacterium]|nr:TolC family protein [bacterium]
MIKGVTLTEAVIIRVLQVLFLICFSATVNHLIPAEKPFAKKNIANLTDRHHSRFDRVRLSLEKAIALALKNEKNVLLSQEEVRQYRYKLKQNLGFLPDISLEGSKTLDEKLLKVLVPPIYPGAAPQELGIDFKKKYEFNFHIIQPLFRGGKIVYSFKNARLDLQMVREKSNNSRKEVILKVKKNFYNILVMQELLKAHKDARQTAESNYKHVKERYSLGMASKYDLLIAEMAASERIPRELEVEKALTLSVLNLKYMTGIPEKNTLIVEGELQHAPYNLKLPELIKKSLSNSSEILQMVLQKKKISNMQKMAYGQYLPEIFLIAMYTYGADYFNFDSNNWNQHYSVSLGIKLPIFNQMKRSARVGEIKVMKRMANLNYKQLEEATKLKINKIYLTLQQEYKAIQIGLKTIETAKEGLRIAKLTYSEGLISMLELKVSGDQLTRAKVNYLQSLYNYNIAAAELEKLAGSKINKTINKNNSQSGTTGQPGGIE